MTSPQRTHDLIPTEWNENVNSLVKMQLREAGRQKEKRTGRRICRGLKYLSYKTRSQEILSTINKTKIEFI